MIVRNVPIETYHADNETISSTGLAEFASDPVLWFYRKRGLIPRNETTTAQRFGTQVHDAIERGVSAVAVTVPREVLNKDGHRRGKAYTDWLADQPTDALILKEGEPNPFEFIDRHLRFCPQVKPFFETPAEYRELSIYAAIHDVACRARIDVLSSNSIIGDWKTCRDISEYGFRRDMMKLRYPLRAAFYQLLVYAEIGELLPFCTIAIENVAPWKVRVFEIDPEWLENGRKEVAKLLPKMSSFHVVDAMDQKITTLSAPFTQRQTNEVVHYAID